MLLCLALYEQCLASAVLLSFRRSLKDPLMLFMGGQEKHERTLLEKDADYVSEYLSHREVLPHSRWGE